MLHANSTTVDASITGSAHQLQSRRYNRIISIHGLKSKSTSGGDFKPGLHVRAVLNNGCEKAGIVVWSGDDMANLMLLDPFEIEDLGSIRQLSLSRN